MFVKTRQLVPSALDMHFICFGVASGCPAPCARTSGAPGHLHFGNLGEMARVWGDTVMGPVCSFFKSPYRVANCLPIVLKIWAGNSIGKRRRARHTRFVSNSLPRNPDSPRRGSSFGGRCCLQCFNGRLELSDVQFMNLTVGTDVREIRMLNIVSAPLLRALI
jgi:hypothetical protein